MSAQPKRQQSGIACEECRRKRIRCDRGTPQCAACANSGADCIVRDGCPPRGPKKGYLKALQKKIESLQARLEDQQEATAAGNQPSTPPQDITATDGLVMPTSRERTNSHSRDGSSVDNNEAHNTAATTPVINGHIQPWPGAGLQSPMIHLEPWECIDTSNPYSCPTLPGLDPYQEPSLVIIAPELHVTPMMHNDLDQLYFDRAYAFAPIVRASRYRSWSKQPNKSKQEACLQRAMWTLASSLSNQFQISERQLYEETRHLLHALESEDPCHQGSIEQAQAWILLSIYELTCDNYHRGMLSAGRAFRLIQMMRLYEIDAPQSPPATQPLRSDHGQQLSLHTQRLDDWIDLETKRRTFWLAYTIDRFTSMVDGLHLFFNERMIRTRLPAPEANFASGNPIVTSFLSDMIPELEPEWPDCDLSPFTEAVISATIYGRVLEHKQEPPARTWDAAYDFCRRHRSLSALLAQRTQASRLAAVENMDPTLTFTALSAHMAVLMLYDLVESQPLGVEAQAVQLTRALQEEHHQQSLDAVANTTVLVAALGQHFQTHPLTPFLLLLGARFTQSHPGLNDAASKLMPCIITTLQTSTNFCRLAQNFLQLLGAQANNWRTLT